MIFNDSIETRSQPNLYLVVHIPKNRKRLKSNPFGYRENSKKKKKTNKKNWIKKKKSSYGPLMSHHLASLHHMTNSLCSIDTCMGWEGCTSSYRHNRIHTYRRRQRSINGRQKRVTVTTRTHTTKSHVCSN